MCINANMYMYIHTCTYIYIYTCLHIYTHTHICTHTYKIYICMHASTPGTTSRQQTREKLMQTQEALHVSFVRRNQTTFRTSNARTSWYPLPETPKPLHPPSPLPNIPQNSSQPRASAVFLFYTDQMNRVHSSEEAPRSFTMAPCVVVKRLEGK